jgi:transcription termination factor NusB
MYGLEKSKDDKFNFDLEIDLKKNPKRQDEIFKRIDENITSIKNELRKASDKKDLDKLGILLQGYQAMQKVLKKAVKS